MPPLPRIYRPRWKFAHIDSRTMNVKNPLGNIKGKTLTLVHNRPGSFSFQSSMDNEEIDDIHPITSGIMAYRQDSTGMWSEEWSGMVKSISEDWTGNGVSIEADGWLQFLERRFLRRAKDFRDVNPATGFFWTDAEIIFELLNEMNTSNINWQVDQTGQPFNYVIPTPYKSAGLPDHPTPIWTGTSFGFFNPTHERRYQIEKFGAPLDAIQQLTDIENGCDIRVHPVTRKLDVWDSYGEARPNSVFGYRVAPNNMRQFGREINTDMLINYEQVFSSQGNVIPQYADTRDFPSPTGDVPKLGEDSMEYYGLMEEQQSIGVGSGGQPAETLRIFAGAEVTIRSAPRETYTGLPLNFNGAESAGRIPEPFVDYTIGDTVRLNAKRRKRQINDLGVRVFGMTVTPDDNSGSEIISNLQISL